MQISDAERFRDLGKTVEGSLGGGWRGSQGKETVVCWGFFGLKVPFVTFWLMALVAFV